MGKKGGSTQLPGLKQALAQVNALGRSMTRESNADYSVALSALNAGQANLRKQTRALTRDMLAGQLTQTASLSKMARNARALRGDVKAEQARVTNRYGSALGQSVASQYGVARAVAGGTGKVITGAAKASRKTTKVAQTVAGIAQAGVVAQKAAAKYSLNQALQQRAIIDNQTLAGLMGQLYNTALQYNMQMAMYERQRADALADAKKAELGVTSDTVRWLTGEGGEIGAWLVEADETGAYVDEQGNFSVQKAVEAYKAEMQLDPSVNAQDANQLALITEAARNMNNGMDADTAMAQAVDSLFGAMPGWDRMTTKQGTLAAITASTQAMTEARAMQNLSNIESVSINGGADSPIAWWDNVPDPTDMEFRDATAAALREQYGASTAKAWLRESTNFSDEAIDMYLSMLPAELAGDLSFTQTAPATPSGAGGYRGVPGVSPTG